MPSRSDGRPMLADGGSSFDAMAPDAAAADASPAVTDLGRLSRLTLDFTTKTQHGKYTPANVGAAWVEDEDNRDSWVHTFELWGSLSEDVPVYTAAKGPLYNVLLGPNSWMFGPDAGIDPPDVITGATHRMHGPHSESWNLKDMQGVEVHDGNYRVRIEVAEEGGGGVEQLLTIPFVKAGKPIVVALPDSEFFSDIKLSLE
jgi:hypothetical protein